MNLSDYEGNRCKGEWVKEVCDICTVMEDQLPKELSTEDSNEYPAWYVKVGMCL
jgi:hypothetical protein